MTAARAQLVDFTRPYYVEGVALLTRPSAANKNFDKLLAGGAQDAGLDPAERRCRDTRCTQVLPQAQVMQIDTQANVIQALEVEARRRRGGRPLDGALAGRRATRTATPTPARSWYRMLYGAALRQGDLDWLNFVNTTFNVAMFGHENELYDAAFKEYFGLDAADAHDRASPPSDTRRTGGVSALPRVLACRARQHDGLPPQLQPDLAQLRQALGRAAPQPRAGRRLDRHRHRHRPRRWRSCYVSARRRRPRR